MLCPSDLVTSPVAKAAVSRKTARRQLFLNYKGGTGKTTISAAYGQCLAMKGKRVLMVDLDAQAHLTACFNKEDIKQERSLYSVIVRGGRLKDIVLKTSTPNIDILPSSISLSSLEIPLSRMPLKEFRLRSVLREVEKNYDHIIIDSAPSISILGLNGILASDEILIPLLADFLSFHGLKILLETLASIEKDFKFYLGRIFIFLNRFRYDYPVCRQCREAVKRFYPDYALDTVINESPEIIEASSLGKSVFDLYPDSQISRDVTELVRRVNGI